MPDLRTILVIGLFILPSASANAANAWRDPTAPHGQTKKENPHAETGFALSLLLVSPERQLAMINGSLVKIGDRVEEAMVKSITPAGVLLLHKGRKIRLPPPIQVDDPKKYVDLSDEP
ncbi:MAG: hypothetical protein HQL65_12000 [Magnetococcales bacterium]|nr:hypothetical protein [Magnetococcales bacterium]